MKTLIAVALAATSLPVITSTAAARESSSASGERQVCTQLTIRAGSRMSGRRICRTPSQWREALGPDWRSRISGRNQQDDMEALVVRSAPVDASSIGQQGIPITSPGHGGPSPN